MGEEVARLYTTAHMQICVHNSWGAGASRCCTLVRMFHSLSQIIMTNLIPLQAVESVPTVRNTIRHFLSYRKLAMNAIFSACRTRMHNMRVYNKYDMHLYIHIIYTYNTECYSSRPATLHAAGFDGVHLSPWLLHGCASLFLLLQCNYVMKAHTHKMTRSCTIKVTTQ